MIVAAVQARLGSTRLPGKVLMPILGEPMIARIVERVARTPGIDQVAIATTALTQDDPLAQLAVSKGWGVVRGSVDDLVERLCLAVTAWNADVLVRIWGDCPFVDPDWLQIGLTRFLDERLDHLTSFSETRTFPAGLDFEIYRRSTLEALLEESNPFFREFPFEFVWRQPERFRTGVVVHTPSLSDLHLTVDYPEDLTLATRIYQGLYPQHPTFGLTEIVAWLQANPDVDIVERPRNQEYLAKKETQA